MVVIIFPPQWIPNHSYLAPFLLCARLKAKGIDCRVYDFNLLFYQTFLREGVLTNFRGSKLFFNPSIYNKTLQKAKDAFSFNNDFVSIDMFSVLFKYKAYKSTELWKALKDKNNIFYQAFAKYLEKINLSGCEVLGISVIAYSQIIPALTLAYLVKQIKQDIKIILGGDMISRIAAALKKEGKIWEYVDAIICGEGEYAIDDIANSIKAGWKLDLKKVPNTITKNSEDSLIEKIPFDLSKYRMADYSDINIRDYLSPLPIMTLEMSRGCYWSKCAYCETTEVPFRSRNINDVVDEVEYLYIKHNVQHFSFADLALPPNKMFLFASEINKRRLPIYWKCMIRAEPIFIQKNIEILYKGGCRMVLLGIESIDNKILKTINKGTDPLLISEILKKFSENNIWVHGYFMIGFPGETKQQIMKTLNFILNNNQTLNSFSISKFVLLRDSIYFRNSKLYNIAIYKNQNENLRTAHFKFNSGTSYEFASIERKIKRILEVHPYVYSKWKSFDINYLFLYITQKGISYFKKTSVNN